MGEKVIEGMTLPVRYPFHRFFQNDPEAICRCGDCTFLSTPDFIQRV